VSDAVLQSRVSAVVASQKPIPPGSIAVDVAEGVVRLSGVVGSTSELQDLGAIVRAVPGVREVRFSVAIKGTPPPGS